MSQYVRITLGHLHQFAHRIHKRFASHQPLLRGFSFRKDRSRVLSHIPHPAIADDTVDAESETFVSICRRGSSFVRATWSLEMKHGKRFKYPDGVSCETTFSFSSGPSCFFSLSTKLASSSSARSLIISKETLFIF